MPKVPKIVESLCSVFFMLQVFATWDESKQKNDLSTNLEFIV
jgi:hypothetical protein